MRRLACCLALLALSAAARAAEPTAPAPPANPVDFALTDVRTDKAVALKDFAARKAIVVVFIGTECPVNNAYMARLVELHKAYADKGVQFVAVNSNWQDTPARIA